MKVKMLMSQVGPGVERHLNDVVDVDKSEAVRMFNAGIAEPVKAEKRKATTRAKEKAVQ